jgi:CMP-N-acetylneuraminic acid synthetase
MKVLALIPARIGSQRLPRKNLLDLGGKPLLRWTIDVAKESMVFVDIVVSTDAHEISTLAKANGVFPLIRPTSLADSVAPMLPVVRHAANNFPGDIIVLLQPTSPFRSVEDIHGSLELMKNSGGDAVISVGVPEPDYCFERGHAQRLREAKNIVVANGALYLITREHLMVGDWYNGITYAYEMPPERSLDIDTEMDITIARAMVKSGQPC